MLERLEDRVVPTVNLFYFGGVLNVEAANSPGNPAFISVSTSNAVAGVDSILTIHTDLDHMTFVDLLGNQITTPSGFNLNTLSPGYSTLTALVSNPLMPITEVAIGAQGLSPVVPGQDTVDYVSLGSLSLGALNVSAGTISIQAGTSVGSGGLTASAGTINFEGATPASAIAVAGKLTASAGSTGTINFQAGAVVTGTGDLNVSAGTINFNAAVATTGNLTASATTINFQAGAVANVAGSAGLTASATTINFQAGAVVKASSVSLTSVNSLAFAQTGVPYLGSVKIHDGPPAGQPFAGDPYITGPDWGAYGYAPGDEITLSITTAGSTISVGPYVIDTVIGHNLYLDSSSNVGSGNFADVTVQCTGFTPQIQASSVTLDVTGAGSTISGALSGAALPGAGQVGKFVLLNAATAGGNITLQDLPPTSTILALGTLNAGTGTIQLAVNGTVSSGALLNYVLSQPPFNNTSYSSYANVVNLTAGAVDLTTTGSGSQIGFIGGSASTNFPITTQGGNLTVTANDGDVYIHDSSPAGLTIDSVVADEGGQAPTMVDGQIKYNSTPGSSTPHYTSGTRNVVIDSTGPIVLNSVSATGFVTITSAQYILEGNEQSPKIIAQGVDLFASGTADYHGQVTFAQGSNGDTLSLPATGPTWTSLGFAAGDSIVVSGALASPDNGAFTIASVSLDGFTLILTASYALTPETQAGVTVGDGMIGQPNAVISLSDVPLFDARTNDGEIYLEAGIDSTAEYVSAGGMHGMVNGVSVTSQADFLTIEYVYATGEAALAMNSGALVEYNGGNYTDRFGHSVTLPGIVTGQIVSLTSPYNIGTTSSHFKTDATSGLSVAATATSPSSAGIYIDNIDTSPLTAIGVRTFDGSVAIQSAGGELSFDNNMLSETGAAVVTFANTDDSDGSNGNVVVSGTVHVSSIVAGIGADGTAGAGQILTNSTNSGVINGDGGMVLLSAGSGIGTSGTPVDIANVATLDATTNTGVINVADGTALRSTLTVSASTSAGDIDVTWNGDIDLSSEMSSTTGVVLDSISAPGTVTLDAVGGAIVDEFDSTVSASTLVLTADRGIGTAGSPLETTSRGTLTLTATAGQGLFLDGSTALAVHSATALHGDLSISAAGNLTLLGQVADAAGNVTLTATAGALTTGNITTSAAAITTTGQETVTPAIMEPYITVGAALLIDAGQANQETVSVTAVTATTFTASFANKHAANFAISTAATANSISAGSVAPISAGNLTITAAQIGSPSDVIQTKATTINATANYGGVYLSNGNSNPLKLTAAAVGTSSGSTANNVEIYSAGRIVLLQQTTALTQLATSVPVALFSPGGALTLVAGERLSADGATVSGTSTLDITSATPPARATSTLNASGQVGTVSVGFSGSGYTTAPTVTFSGGGGSGASATATINAKGQLSISITNGGSGYTSPPTVTISPPGDDIYTGTYNINGTTAVSSNSLPYLRSLVIVSNTAEVSVSPGGTTGIPALITLADLTALAAQTNGNGTVPVAFGTETVATTNGTTTVTIVAGAITIDNLGQDGSSGTAVIPNGWSLVLDATDGPIVFLNLGDTIATSGPGSTITVEAGTSTTDVAALGNLTTGGGTITVTAGGNIAVGTLAAGKTGGTLGTVSVTSANGAILFGTASTPTTPNVIASSTTLNEHTQPVPTTQSVALAELHATQVIAAADAASARAVAAADAAGAQAAAELASVNALKAALTSIQAAVTTVNQTYQAAVQTTVRAQSAVDKDNNTVNADITYVTNLNITAGSFTLIAATLSAVGAVVGLSAAGVFLIPGVNQAAELVAASINVAAAAANLISAATNAAELSAQVTLNNDSNTLATDMATLNTAQANQAQAYAQLHADMDTEAAFAAAYDVAQQAYASSEQAYTNAQTTSAQVQAAGDTAQAIAIAGVVFAAPAQPLTATATGSGPVNIQAHSPLTVSANTTAVDAIHLTATPEAATYQGQVAFANNANGDTMILPNTGPTWSSFGFAPGEAITVSGASARANDAAFTIAGISPDGYTLTLTAQNVLNPETDPAVTVSTPGDDLSVNAGVTVQSTGSSVTLLAGDNVVIQSGSTIEAHTTIAITANGNDDPNGATVTVAGTLIAPSILVDGGSSGDNTLNFNAQGQAVTISGDTITAGTLAPVTFTNIQDVNITNASSLTLDGTNGVANTMSLVGTGQEAGTATLNGVAFSFSGMTSFSYQGGAGDAIAVTPFANPNVPWNLGVTVAGGTGAPASLTYNAPGPDDTVMASGTDAGSVVEPGVATVPFSNVGQVTITYQGIQNLEILPNLTVSAVGGTYNGKAFPATVLVNGAASLDGIAPTLTYYSGTLVSPLHKLSGAPITAGTYTAVAAFAGDATYVSAAASTTFAIAQGKPQVSVKPVQLTYGTALANSQLSGTAAFIINGTKVSVPGIYSYTSAAGTVLAASASTYTEAVTFTPNNTNYATQTNLSVLVTVGKAATTTAVRSSLGRSGLGQSVTFTATVTSKAPGSGTPTGTVTFKDGTTVLATVMLSGGVATFSTSSLALGSHSITAVYVSDTGNHSTSTSTAVSQVVVAKASAAAVTTSRRRLPAPAARLPGQ
jgi:hypothetical protein